MLHLFLHIALCFLPAAIAIAQASSNTTHLIVPALVTDANNNTVLECWRLESPFTRSSVPGVSGTQVATISNNTDLAYAIIPPRYDGGLHTAPIPQLVHFLSGVAHITLPHDPSADLWVVGGKGGLLFALDTIGTGHVTRYPSDQETVALTAPFSGGVIPHHEVVARGPCLGLQTFV